MRFVTLNLVQGLETCFSLRYPSLRQDATAKETLLSCWIFLANLQHFDSLKQSRGSGLFLFCS
jgi:hypothetical protein